MATRGDPLHDLHRAVQAVRDATAGLSFPLPLPSAGPARTDQAALLAQVDDYLLPRLSRLDAPLLVVVGGSTGAGKSTLLNSLVQAPVSPAGVLRPTTRVPVLVCHPADTAWFRSGGPLANLVRTAGPSAPLQLISAPALPAGVAFVDAPDFDAVVDSNRNVAMQLLGAADLWLFVTTAARYADAVPWRLLSQARENGTVVALVLSRVPQPPGTAATVEVVAHLTELLTAHGLGTAPLFVLPETQMRGLGLLPESVIASLRTWFGGLSADAHSRSAVARCTLDGSLAALPRRARLLASAADEQVDAAETLAEQVGLAYGGARATVDRTLRESALAGSVPVDSGRLTASSALPRPPAADAAPSTRGPAAHRRAPAGDGRAWWDRLLTPGPDTGERRRAWESNLVTLVCSAAADAAEQARAGWLEHPAGRAMIAPGLAAPSVGLAGKVGRLARAWNGGAPEDLLHRVAELLDTEAARWLDGLAGVPPGRAPAQRLREAGAALEVARTAAALGAVASIPPTPAGLIAPEAAGEAELDRAQR